MMDWHAKLRLLRKHLNDDTDLSIVNFLKEPAPKQEIEETFRQFPSLSKEYGEFLAVSNGAYFAQVTFAGTLSCKLGSIDLLTRQWAGIDLGFIPFAKNAGGTGFFFASDGAIFRITRQSGSIEKIRIGSGFGDFLVNLIMGPRFPELIGVESWNLILQRYKSSRNSKPRPDGTSMRWCMKGVPRHGRRYDVEDQAEFEQVPARV